MIKRILFVALISFLLTSISNAKTYIRDYTYSPNKIDTKETCQIITLDHIKKLLLQEIGTHIRQKITISRDSLGKNFASEDVEAITAGLTKAKIIEEKWSSKQYYAKVELVADTSQVLNALNQYAKEHSDKRRQELEALKENHRKLRESRKAMQQLRLQLKQVKREAEIAKISASYLQETKRLSLYEMYDKAYGYESQGQFKEAVYWYHNAADNGYADAQFSLGRLYRKGLGVKQDDKQAIYWYRKAADQEYVWSQVFLGLAYYDGVGVKKDYKQAAYWYRKAADRGNVVGQTNIGGLYQLGKGVERDYKQAVYWYQKASDKGFALAQTNLASLYQGGGSGLEQDYKQAIYWYRKAADKDSALGQTSLGSIYEYGIGVEKDYKLALYWYQKAAGQDNADGQYEMGNMYALGKGVEQSIDTAAFWYHKAAEQGQITAKIYDAAIKGSAEDQQDFGKFIASHADGKNKKLGLSFIRKSGEQGSTEALYTLGTIYESGKYNIQKSDKEAFVWFLKAAELGHEHSILRVAGMYSGGKHFKKAVTWYHKAAELGNRKAEFILGLIYKTNKFGLQNKKTARSWLKKACESGHGGACDMLDEF